MLVNKIRILDSQNEAEDVKISAESDLIESLLNQDSSIISSSMIDSILDEFAGELIFLKLIPPRIDEADCDPKEEIHLIDKLLINDSMIELRGTFQAWLQQQKDQVVNLDSYSPKPLQCQKILICYDDEDDEESSTPLRDIIIFELPLCIAITPVLSTKEPKDSLIMGDEHLDTIPEKESVEFIKSSV
nr:hypothetical protein [Tanacetum cinerariifolium]